VGKAFPGAPRAVAAAKFPGQFVEILAHFILALVADELQGGLVLGGFGDLSGAGRQDFLEGALKPAGGTVKFYVNNKSVVKDKKSPFKATVKVSKRLRAGKTYKYKVKVYFKPTSIHPKGHVVTKSGKFKICK